MLLGGRRAIRDRVTTPQEGSSCGKCEPVFLLCAPPSRIILEKSSFRSKVPHVDPLSGAELWGSAWFSGHSGAFLPRQPLTANQGVSEALGRVAGSPEAWGRGGLQPGPPGGGGSTAGVFPHLQKFGRQDPLALAFLVMRKLGGPAA